MAPLDAVGTDVVGSVRAVVRSVPAAVVASSYTAPPGGSPLDEFFRQEKAARAGPKQDLAITAVDEPRFGRIAFSAGVGDVLIALQAERPLDGEASASEAQHAVAAYRYTQVLRDALPPPSQERQSRGVERGFWGQPTTATLFPMMV